MVKDDSAASGCKNKHHNLTIAPNIQAKLMAYENTVLSLNSDRHSLVRQEADLQKDGFTVISVSSAIQARFEIEMGRCGTFLISYITPLAIYSDLASLFRRSCPDGLIVFIAEHDRSSVPDADILLWTEEAQETVGQRIRLAREAKAS